MQCEYQKSCTSRRYARAVLGASYNVDVANAFRAVEIASVRDGVRHAGVDRAATEEPLEIRLHDRPFAVIMRTPGADRELAAGFLLAERVILGADDLGTIEYCSESPAEAGHYNRRRNSPH